MGEINGRSGTTLLPEWLQQLAAECPEEDRRQLDEVIMRKQHSNQVDADRRYRAKQKDKGIVRKTVLVPENRVTELHELCKKWRSEQ